MSLSLSSPLFRSLHFSVALLFSLSPSSPVSFPVFAELTDSFSGYEDDEGTVGRGDFEMLHVLGTGAFGKVRSPPRCFPSQLWTLDGYNRKIVQQRRDPFTTLVAQVWAIC